jgi:type III secretion protein Q
LKAVCATLGRELGCGVTCAARLLDAVVVPSTGLAQSAAFALFELSAVGGMAVVELEPSVLFAILERLAGAGQKAGPVTRLTRLEEASFAYLALSALSTLRTEGELHRCFAPRLRGVTMSRAEALLCLEARRAHVGIELTLTVGQTTAGGRLLLPAVVLETVLKELPAERESTLAPQVLAATLGARCLVGHVPLPSEELERLALGDVVVFEGVRRDGERLYGTGRLVTRGFELTGEFLPEGFSPDQAQRRAIPQETRMRTMNERSEGLPPLPVDVEIELTRLMIPLSELATLKPGKLLPLHINASEPVLLRVGERAVARAELVDIEGEVGARILALLP